MAGLRAALALIVAACLGSGAGAQPPPHPKPEEAPAAAALSRFTSPTLTRFESDAEFDAYVAAVRQAARARGDYYSGNRAIRFAQAQPGSAIASDAKEEPICPPEDPQCADPGESGDQSIVVTGSAVRPSNPSITNNQMRNVEEGDIVKQIDRFLLILSHGRIFVVDTRADGRRSLALADRVNVYRSARSDTWYDEMLVFGDRVLVTGYSYAEEATELSVFRLSPNGRLASEGVFYLTSNDYYDTSNYATRLIGDSLVVYTPLNILWSDGGRFRWPVLRRWLPEEERDEAERQGVRLFDARSIYRPVTDERNPTVHTVSVCPLGPVDRRRDLRCRTTAVAGPPGAEWYVTDRDVYLWSVRWRERHRSPRCTDESRLPLGQLVPALLYRVPHDGSAPRVAGVRGVPFDQFSLQVNDGRFRALVDQRPETCDREWGSGVRPIYLDMPLTALSSRPLEVAQERYTAVPSPGTPWIANRFTETHLVYGGLSPYRRGLPEVDWNQYRDNEAMMRRMRAMQSIPPTFVVPAERPQSVRPLEVRHTVIRAERAGDGFVLTGYGGRRGLSVTLIDVGGGPRIASTLLLDDRFESEGRSHAFNSLIEADGTGLMGLPTSPKEEDSDRHWWRSRASDISFIGVERGGRLVDIGQLDSRVLYDRRDDEDGLPGYECEVSCVDWYGNSRPIFTDGRVFGLTGVELVEGVVGAEGIREIRRFDFARARPRSAMAGARR